MGIEAWKMQGTTAKITNACVCVRCLCTYLSSRVTSCSLLGLCACYSEGPGNKKVRLTVYASTRVRIPLPTLSLPYFKKKSSLVYVLKKQAKRDDLSYLELLKYLFQNWHMCVCAGGMEGEGVGIQKAGISETYLINKNHLLCLLKIRFSGPSPHLSSQIPRKGLGIY